MTLSIGGLEAGLILTVAMAGLSGYGILLVVMWQSLNNRLRSLGHEDRDIRNQMHGILEVLQTQYGDVLDAVATSNKLMAKVYSQKCVLCEHGREESDREADE